MLVVYQDLGTRHKWPVKKGYGQFANQIQGKYPTNSSNSLDPLETQKKDMGAEFCIGDLLREKVAKEVRLYRINANCCEEP